MTNGVLMVIREFIYENYQDFAKYCGDEKIADGNLHEFKHWLSDVLRSEARDLEALRKDKIRLEKEADWLAEAAANGNLMKCPSTNLYLLPDCDDGNEFHNCGKCWREAARRAVEEK